MFFFIKTIIILTFIRIKAFNDIFNISIAEKFPKTNIQLPNYNFITNMPNYHNTEHKLTNYTFTK